MKKSRNLSLSIVTATFALLIAAASISYSESCKTSKKVSDAQNSTTHCGPDNACVVSSVTADAVFSCVGSSAGLTGCDSETVSSTNCSGGICNYVGGEFVDCDPPNCTTTNPTSSTAYGNTCG